MSQQIAELEGPSMTPESTVLWFADRCGVGLERLMSRRKYLRITWERSILMALLYRMHHLSLTDIGNILDRDHTTVLTGIRRCRGDARRRKELAEWIRELRRERQRRKLARSTTHPMTPAPSRTRSIA